MNPVTGGSPDLPTDRKCSRPKCNGDMKPSKAIEQTHTGCSDFIGGTVVTMSPGGPGRLVECLKCSICGWSVSA